MFSLSLSNTNGNCSSCLTPNVWIEEQPDQKQPEIFEPLSESLSGFKDANRTPVKRSGNSKKTLPGSKLLKLLRKTRKANR